MIINLINKLLFIIKSVYFNNCLDMSAKKESLFKQKLKKAKIVEEIKEPNLGVVVEI